MKEGEVSTLAIALRPGPRGSSDETAGATHTPARTRSRTKAQDESRHIGSRARSARPSDRQFHSRRRPVASEEGGVRETRIAPSVLLRLWATPGRIRHLCPPVGQHADELLSDLLGMEAAEMVELRPKRAI